MLGSLAEASQPPQPDFMPDYSVYGGCLRSDLIFPDLPGCRKQSPDWQLQRVGDSPPERELAPAGEQQVDGPIQVRAYRFAEGFRLSFDDTGTFEIFDRGARIVWYAPQGVSEEAARLDVLGRVLAMAFHARGSLCLHGSAVAFPDAGVAFIAPKFHGKSTIAGALCASGALLASDDTVPVICGSTVDLLPGVQEVRLWQDSAARLPETGSALRSSHGGKQIRSAWEAERLLHQPTPLRAIYVLSPVPSEPERPPVARTPLHALQATLALVAHSKLGSLAGGPEAPVLLDQASRVASRVPVYVLNVVRDFDCLDAVVGQLWEWHGATSAASHLAAAGSP